MALLTGLRSGDGDPKAALALDRLARGALHTAGFDRERGSSLLKAVNAAAEQTARMSKTEQQWFAKTEEAKLQRLYGDKYPENRALAR